MLKRIDGAWLLECPCMVLVEDMEFGWFDGYQYVAFEPNPEGPGWVVIRVDEFHEWQPHLPTSAEHRKMWESERCTRGMSPQRPVRILNHGKQVAGYPWMGVWRARASNQRYPGHKEYCQRGVDWMNSYPI